MNEAWLRHRMKRRKQKAQRMIEWGRNREREALKDWTPLERIERAIPPALESGTSVMHPWPIKKLTQWQNEEWWALLAEGDEGLVHITIQHVSGKPVNNWAAFQQIKNELVGPEQEMIELYPAESRMVNVKDVYHLWGKRGFLVPHGWGI